MEKKPKESEEALKEGNQCIALGLGVGGFGAATGLALGAVCPLCFIVAPGLVGMGLLRRRAAKRGSSGAGERRCKVKESTS